MIHFDILSGKTAGSQWRARRFPVRIGRAPESELRLEEPGVWDNHAELSLDKTEGFLLSAKPSALLSVNGQPAQTAKLRNGDSVELGAVRLRFWLSETRQSSLRAREWFVWSLVLLVCAAEVAAVYLLSD